MGEQTQSQPETLTQPDSPNSQPTEIINNPKPQSPPNSNATLIPLPLPPTTEPPPTLSETPHNPSKIPIRPQKIRKLSTPTPNSATDDHQSSTPQTTTTTTDSSAAASSLTLTAVSPTPTPTPTVRNRRRSASQAARAAPQVIKLLSAEGEMEFAIRHLRAIDPLLVPLIDAHGPLQFDNDYRPFHALAKSILYQQLAYKAGTSIYNRFVALCGGVDAVRPDTVLGLSSQQLKQIGVSGRKATYLSDLANKYNSGILSDETIVKMDDRSLFTMLSMVKGIGSWSVHMFMIFNLHRPDVLPVSDLGVRKGVQLLYGLDDLPRPSQMEQICEKWKPYRSVGAWYMWRLVEGKEGPVAASIAASGAGLGDSHVQPLQQIEVQQDGQQHQLQFVESVNGIGNLGECIWNQ